jgi:hypothetical protein
MPRDAGPGDRQHRSQLAGGGRMVPQNLQDRPSTLVRQGVQHRVHTSNVTDLLRTCQGTYASG